MEILLELVLEGGLDALGERRCPIILRVLAAIVLVAFYGGIVGLLAFVSITQRNLALGVMTLLTAGLVGAAAYIKIRKIKGKYDEND